MTLQCMSALSFLECITHFAAVHKWRCVRNLMGHRRGRRMVKFTMSGNDGSEMGKHGIFWENVAVVGKGGIKW